MRCQHIAWHPKSHQHSFNYWNMRTVSNGIVLVVCVIAEMERISHSHVVNFLRYADTFASTTFSWEANSEYYVNEDGVFITIKHPDINFLSPCNLWITSCWCHQVHYYYLTSTNASKSGNKGGWFHDAKEEVFLNDQTWHNK